MDTAEISEIPSDHKTNEIPFLIARVVKYQTRLLVPILGVIQNLTGHSPDQPALVDPL